MSLGVFFALTSEELQALEACTSDEERRDLLSSEIEPRYFENERLFMAETDKAWEAIHRVLADGELEPDAGPYPLNHVVLGGRQLYSDADYIISLKTAAQVAEIARTLEAIDEAEFRRRYGALDASAYLEKSEEDLEYSVEWFDVTRDFYRRAAASGRPVVFTADQ